MPSLFLIGKYKVYFYSGENGEPIHVHVCEGRPTENSSKLWLTSDGKCIIANNHSQIPDKELKNIMKIVASNFFMICDAWKEYFVLDEIKFYK